MKMSMPPPLFFKVGLQNLNNGGLKVNNELLRFLRKSKNMTQEELGSLLGVTHAMINYYETGKKPIPARRIRQLREIFGDEYIEQAKLFLRGGKS